MTAINPIAKIPPIEWLITQDHPSFKGHFPASPILPGVVILDKIVRLLSEHLSFPYACFIIKNAKFLHPVLPNSRVVVLFQPIEKDRYDVLVKLNDIDAIKCLVLVSLSG